MADIVINEAECKALAKHPEALRALADIHDLWAAEADALDESYAPSVKLSEARAEELRAAADRIEASY